jgi:transmembrane sensor
MSDITHLPQADDLDTQACERIVRLHGRKPSAAELQELHDWMNQSPRHYETLMHYAHTWDDANILTAILGAAPDAKPNKVSVSPRPRRAFLGWSAAFAGGAAAAMIGGWLGYLSLIKPYPHASYATALGQQQHILLPDAPEIHLNTDSLARVVYTREYRDIFLEEGEALFEVAHDAGRPFRVHVAGNIIRAVGTAFSVRVDKTSVKLVVSDGQVDFIPQPEPASGVAAAGSPVSTPAPLQRVSSLHVARYAQGALEVQTVDEQSLSRSLAWRDGVLAFNGEPLEDVVTEFSRYSSAEFVFENPSLRKMRIGGYFDAGRIDGLIIALEGSFGIDVRRDETGRYILSGGNIE